MSGYLFIAQSSMNYVIPIKEEVLPLNCTFKWTFLPNTVVILGLLPDVTRGILLKMLSFLKVFA